MGKYTWNLGLAAFPSLTFILLRLYPTPNAAPGNAALTSSGVFQSEGSSLWSLSQSMGITFENMKFASLRRSSLYFAQT